MDKVHHSVVDWAFLQLVWFPSCLILWEKQMGAWQHSLDGDDYPKNNDNVDHPETAVWLLRQIRDIAVNLTHLTYISVVSGIFWYIWGHRVIFDAAFVSYTGCCPLLNSLPHCLILPQVFRCVPSFLRHHLISVLFDKRKGLAEEM